MFSGKKIVWTILVLLAILSCFDVAYPKDVMLHHIGTLIILIILAADIRKEFLSFFAFACIALFNVFHIIGAHWLYSYVPYNDWAVSLFGWDINAYFGFTRNQYDRFVHFVSGFLFYPYLLEYYRRRVKLSMPVANLVSWLAIQTLGMLYEVMEWYVSILLSPESTENYNGQQGDIWDAHKDMALALLSSSMVYVYYRIKLKKI
jgi:putative membrane protein